MKTTEQIEHARAVMREKIQTAGLTPVQSALLAGMLNALVWVMDGEHSSIVDRILSGEPLAPGRDTSAGEAVLKSIQTK